MVLKEATAEQILFVDICEMLGEDSDTLAKHNLILNNRIKSLIHADFEPAVFSELHLLKTQSKDWYGRVNFEDAARNVRDFYFLCIDICDLLTEQGIKLPVRKDIIESRMLRFLADKDVLRNDNVPYFYWPNQQPYSGSLSMSVVHVNDGQGVYVDSNHILTANHALAFKRGGANINHINGVTEWAKIVDQDREPDLALLYVEEPKDVPKLELASSYDGAYYLTRAYRLVDGIDPMGEDVVVQRLGQFCHRQDKFGFTLAREGNSGSPVIMRDGLGQERLCGILTDGEFIRDGYDPLNVKFTGIKEIYEFLSRNSLV
jgi:hypothetical protein